MMKNRWEHRAATNIQRIYRGHVARVLKVVLVLLAVPLCPLLKHPRPRLRPHARTNLGEEVVLLAHEGHVPGEPRPPSRAVDGHSALLRAVGLERETDGGGGGVRAGSRVHYFGSSGGSEVQAHAPHRAQ